MLTSAYYGDISLSETTWKLSRNILPHRCIFTGKWIRPFTLALHGKRPGTGGLTEGVVWQHYWTMPKEFTIQKLKGNV